MGTEITNSVNPSFKAENMKTEMISPQTKVTYDSKPDEFIKEEGMSTNKKVAIGAGVVLATILAVFAVIRFRGRSGVINEVRDAGRRLTRNGSGVSDSGPRNLSRGGQNPPPPPPGGGAVSSPPVQKVSAVSKASDTANPNAASAPIATKTEQNISTQTAQSKGNSLLGQTAEQISEEQRQIYKERLDKLVKERGLEKHSFGTFSKVANLSFKDRYLGDKGFYAKIRIASYKSCGNPNISKVTSRDTEKIRLANSALNPGWDIRVPVALGEIKSHSIERISLNVRPDEKLIKELDEYLSIHANGLQAYYKTPDTFEGWFERHDPITIYFGKKCVTQQVLDDIARIADHYARETGTSVLRGRRFGKGCSWQRQVTKKDMHEFIERFEKILGEPVPDRMKRHYLNNSPSTGQLCAAHDVLNAITGEKFEPLLPKL